MRSGQTIARRRLLTGLLAFFLLVLPACQNNGADGGNANSPVAESPVPTAPASPEPAAVEVDEQPSTVFYEIFVRSFADSNGDGIGDLKGLIGKLDYLNDGDPETTTDLGVGGIWLMPVNPSPSYHGYDVTDYYGIHPDYGTLEDFQTLLDEAHKRGIKVIMDLVVNHTSSEHPWFEASAAGDADYRDWYVWAQEGDNTLEGSATGGGQAWHPKDGGHYLGTFWGGMPDLNFDHAPVREEMSKIGQYWLELGVDGFRLDAAKHIYEDVVSQTNDETVVERNLAWWNEFRSAMEETKEDVYLVGEVWDAAAAKVAPYFETFDSSFNFGLAQDLVNTAKSESGSSIGSRLERIYGLYSKSSGGNFVDAVFLTNHDQNRVMSQLEGNLDHAKMAAALLLTMPGNPFIYYGEEIGMKGMKPDEYIREPMLWGEGDAEAQTSWEAPKFNLDGAPTVESMNGAAGSLLESYKTFIRWRAEEPALANGTIAGYAVDADGAAAYIRRTNDEEVLVVHNLTGSPLEAQLEEGAFAEIAQSNDASASLEDGTLTIGPYSTVVLK